MKKPFTGSWCSACSNIPGYTPGGEWLHFSECEDHVLELAQRGGKGRPSLTRFVLQPENDAFRLCPINKATGAVGDGWSIVIEIRGADEIVVTPPHGFTTVFRREERLGSSYRQSAGFQVAARPPPRYSAAAEKSPPH